MRVQFNAARAEGPGDVFGPVDDEEPTIEQAAAELAARWELIPSKVGEAVSDLCCINEEALNVAMTQALAGYVKPYQDLVRNRLILMATRQLEDEEQADLQDFLAMRNNAWNQP